MKKKYRMSGSLSSALVRSYLGHGDPQEVRSVVDQYNLSGKNIISELEDNGLVCLAGQVLSENDFTGAIPDPELRLIKEKTQALIAARQLQEDAINQIGGAFQEHGIQAVLTGGFGRLREYYKDDDVRCSADIDLLIDKSQIDRAVECLEKLGYICKFHNKGVTAKKSLITCDISLKPADFLTITAIPEEGECFRWLDEIWRDNLEKSDFFNFFQFSRVFELLLEILHFSYKHQFERMVWGLDIALLLTDLTDAEREILAKYIKNEKISTEVKIVFSYIVEIIGFRFKNEILDLIHEIQCSGNSYSRAILYNYALTSFFNKNLCYFFAFLYGKNKKLKLKMLKNFMLHLYITIMRKFRGIFVRKK